MTRVGDAVRAVFRAVAFAPDGFGDAVQPARFVGGTVSGPPTDGDFEAADFVIAQNGTLWVCAAAGSPGTWVGTVGSAGNQTLDGIKTFNDEPRVPSLQINGADLTVVGGRLYLNGAAIAFVSDIGGPYAAPPTNHTTTHSHP